MQYPKLRTNPAPRGEPLWSRVEQKVVGVIVTVGIAALILFVAFLLTQGEVGFTWRK